jgi:hypothetical protein
MVALSGRSIVGDSACQCGDSVEKPSPRENVEERMDEELSAHFGLATRLTLPRAPDYDESIA